MSEEATKLADKLLSEGERTLAFFRALSAHDWTRHVYADGAHWTVRQAFEHLALSERSMLRLCEGLIAGGRGAPEDFDIDRFNREHTDRLGASPVQELLEIFSGTRQATAAFARGLDDDQLALRGRHPAMGDSSLAEILKMIYLHNTMHVRDIKKLLA